MRDSVSTLAGRVAFDSVLASFNGDEATAELSSDCMRGALYKRVQATVQ